MTIYVKYIAYYVTLSKHFKTLANIFVNIRGKYRSTGSHRFILLSQQNLKFKDLNRALSIFLGIFSIYKFIKIIRLMIFLGSSVLG